jgi:outer membrane lipoprotein carrier protein
MSGAAILALLGAGADLSSVLRALELRYNAAQTLQVSFEQTYRARNVRREAGELYLRRPGRMRWEYREPPGKLFVSDGKYFYFYSPSAQRAEKLPLKESDDLRAPLAFLLGKLDFSRDFGSYVTSEVPEGLKITARPKTQKLPYREVEFVVAAGNQIRRLVIQGQDASVMEFQFSGEKLNAQLPESLFIFQAPPGTEVVDATGER